MFTVSVVGIMYISGIIKDSVASAFSIIGNMFKVSVGVVNGIARIVGAFVLMLLSVFGTVFFYQIFKEILFAIPVALSKMLALAPSADNAIVVSSYEGLACVLTCFICFFIGQVALKNRKEFIHGFDKTIEAIVHQIVGTNPGQGKQLNPDTPRLRDVAGQTMAGANAIGNGIFGKKNEDGVREGGALRTATDWGNSMAEKARNSKAGQYVGETLNNAKGEVSELAGRGKESAISMFNATGLGHAVYDMKKRREAKRIAKSGGNEKPKGSFKKVANDLKASPIATISGGISGAFGKVKDASYAVKNYNTEREGLADFNEERAGKGQELVGTSRRDSIKHLMNESAETRKKDKETRRLEKLSKRTERDNQTAQKRKEVDYNVLFDSHEKQQNKELAEWHKEQRKANKQMTRRGRGQETRKGHEQGKRK